ncbi:MAG: hypothetical protein WCI18_05290 [Pseudomonadota bacterium]
MKFLIFLAWISTPVAALDIGSRDLVELKVTGDQVVNWQGDGFNLGCQRGASCLFDASKFSKGSYPLLYFREENQSLYFGSEILEMSSDNVRKKLELRLPLEKKITPDDVFASVISGVGFIQRDQKKIILKNFPEILNPNDIVETSGDSTIYINLSMTESALIQKDSRIKIGGPDSSISPHIWLGGNGTFSSPKESFFQVGNSRVQSGKKGGQILIYESTEGIGLLPLEGEYEIMSKNSNLKISAPFGLFLKDQKKQLISRLSCDDPLEFIKAGIAFTAECKQVKLKSLGINSKILTDDTVAPSNPISQEWKLPWLKSSLLKSGLDVEQKLIMGTLDTVHASDPFQVKIRYYLLKNDCAAVMRETPEAEQEKQLKIYYNSICSVRSSKYSSAKNNLLWVRPRLTDDSLSQSVDTLLNSDWVRPLPKENLSLFVGRDSNGFLKEAHPTYSPFKAYKERFMPFFGGALNRQWRLFEEEPLEFRLQLSLEAKAYLVENQIPFARHYEDITLPMAFHISKGSLVELSPIVKISGNGFPLETIGAGMYAKIKIDSLSVKTDVVNTDDFNDQPEILDYVSGNPTAFTSTVNSDRPFMTRTSTIAYGFFTPKTSNNVYLEYLKSRYLKSVENNQSFQAFAIGGDSYFELMKLLQINLGFKYENRSYIEAQKGSLLTLSGKSLWNFSPDYSVFLKLDHTTSQGNLVNANWTTTQISMGGSKDLR